MAQHCVVDGAMAGGLTANKDDTANTLSAEMAAKVIDCDRNNDLGPLHAQISEGVPANTNGDLPAGPHIGLDSSEQHSTGLRNLF